MIPLAPIYGLLSNKLSWDAVLHGDSLESSSKITMYVTKLLVVVISDTTLSIQFIRDSHYDIFGRLVSLRKQAKLLFKKPKYALKAIS